MRTTLSVLLLTAAVAVSAQERVALMDMTLNGNKLTEKVQNKTFDVVGNHDAENVKGAAGKALRLDGYSTYAIGSVNASSFNTSKLTVALWVAPETYPMMNVMEAANLTSIIAGNIDDGAKSGFAFTLSSQGDYGFDCYVGGWKIATTATENLPCYEWSHLVATIDTDAKKVKLYRNGTLVATKNCTTPINTGAANFYIGKPREELKAGPYHINTFNGLIDDIEVFNGLLSETDIKAYAADNDADLTIPASRFADDHLRPRFHGMPGAAWSNETHGGAYYNGKYHVFFQKNANGPYMARMHWGHIYSDNLYNWKEDRIAIAPDKNYDLKGCWSGCLVVDDDFTGGKPNIIYTAVDNAKATIAQAVPADDDLTTWNKLSKNPIINGKPSGLTDDFRDPYFFTANGKHYLIVGTSKDDIGATTLHRYNNGSWSNDGTLFFQGTNASRNGTFWEMPNVTPMGDKWLFTCTPLGTSVGVETLYWIGDIAADGTFLPTSSTVASPGKLELDGMSKQGFGLLSPTIFKKGDKTIMLGIVPDKLAENFNYQLGWAHTYSLPREIEIASTGKTLIQKPYEGLKAMRTDEKVEKTDFAISSEMDLNPVSGQQFEICGEFEVGTSEFGYKFFDDGTHSAKLSYTPGTRTVKLDVSTLPRWANDGGVFNGIYSSNLPQAIPAGSILKLHVFVDHSIVDVFVNDTWAFSTRVFPTNANADGVKVYADGDTNVKSLGAWMLDPEKDDPTAIEAVTTNGVTAAVTSLGYYDLSGKRIAKPTAKGIYIEKVNASNGTTISRKFIVR